jgi:RNA polymerase sigma factor (sigma-70 family)
VADNLTLNALGKLLTLLDSDRENAGFKYENLRRRLIKFFEWRNCESPEDLSDEVFDRILKKINEGEKIQNINAYSVTIAQFVLKEFLRNSKNKNQLIEKVAEIQQLKAKEIDEVDEKFEKQRNCFEKCLEKLSVEDRKFIISYYDTDERTMINSRKKLADEMNVSLNTIRIKACRIKAKLEKCTLECCQ